MQSFPLELYLQAQQQKAANQQNMNQDIAGIGQGLGQGLEGIGQVIQAQKQKQLLQQLIQQMKTQGAPQQGPPLAPSNWPQQSMTQIPPSQPMSAGGSNIGQDVQMPQPIPTQTPGQMPSSGMGAPPADNSQQIQALLMKLDPEGMIKNMVEQQNPLKQAQAAYYKSRAGALGGGGGSGKSTWWESPEGTVSRNPSEGAFPIQISDAQGAQYTAIPKSSKGRNEALASRAEAMQRSIDVKQIDQLISRTGLTPKQQSQLQMNNQRSSRALQILSQPNITWQELTLGEIDLAGIMASGVPQRDEITSTHFPGWQEQVAKWKTYATGHPTENVPPDIKNKVGQLVNGVIQVDNRILNANAKFAKNMIGPTIRGGLQPQQKKSVDEMTGVLTQSGGQSQVQQQSDPLGILK